MYRKQLVDILDTFFYWNILLLAVFTWYSFGKQDNVQKAVSYASGATTFIALLLIILFHVYTYTPLFKKFKKPKIFEQMFEKLRSRTDKIPKSGPPPDDDNRRFNELLDIIDYPVNDYQVSIVSEQKPTVPTKSVIEIHQPSLTSPNHESIAAEIHQ